MLDAIPYSNLAEPRILREPSPAALAGWPGKRAVIRAARTQRQDCGWNQATRFHIRHIPCDAFDDIGNTAAYFSRD
jgi:hypothetical protein